MPKISEHDHQVSFFQWLRLQHPAVDCVTFATPNAAKRSFKLAAHMRAEGLRSGVPDICCAYPSGEYHGLFIEMKAEKGKLSENQKRWIEALRKSGYAVCVCYGFTEARDCMERYLVGEV